MLGALSDLHYRIGVGASAGAAVLLLASLRFCYDHELPPKPVKPEATVEDALAFSRNIERSTGAYDAYVKRDSERFGLRVAPSATAMGQVFPHRRDGAERVLAPGDAVEVLDLELRLVVDEVRGSRRKHLILEIANRSDRHLAYRVDTRPTRGLRSCRKKRDLEHNAIALAPRQTLRRSECPYRSGYTLAVREVETVELPELGYYYVSATQPERLGVDERAARGHRAPSDTMICRMVQTAAVSRGLESGRLGWRDLVDFYARHRCTTYQFPFGYEAFRRDGEHTLPVVEGAE